MKAKYFLLVLFYSFFCLEASALSSPPATTFFPVFEDSTLKGVLVLSTPPAPQKREAFFERLKKTLVGAFVRNPFTREGKTSTKSALGWIALGAVVLGIVLASAGAVTAAPIFFFGGLLTGIVALVLPKSAEDKAARKKSNTGAIIAVALAVFIAVLGAFAVGSWN